jgi:hypothetical protein
MYLLNSKSPMIAPVCRNLNRKVGEYLFNMGGPRSRTRTETIETSLLGKTRGSIRCPLIISLGLDFGKYSPVRTVEQIMRNEGFRDPEEMKARFLTITGMRVCHISLQPNRISVVKAMPGTVLHQAVLLGLCTTTFFDPSRPVIWTNASLTRCLDLFDTRGFYL